MKWLLPLLIASLWLIVAPIWYLMLRRWKLLDWKELLFGFVVCVGICHFFFFGFAPLARLGIPISAAAALTSLGGVVLIRMFRKRLERESRHH
jgi:hypothetical protein